MYKICLFTELLGPCFKTGESIFFIIIFKKKSFNPFFFSLKTIEWKNKYIYNHWMKSIIEIYYSLFSSTIEMMAFFDWRSDRSSPHFSDKKKIEKLIHSLLTISGTISLSFQSTFLLSFTLLVHYRFPKCQYSVLQGTYLVLETILPNSPTLLLLVSWWPCTCSHDDRIITLSHICFHNINLSCAASHQYCNNQQY